jgi:site-specific DNA-methyltransferase (cytosine-N4-specific)
MRLEWGEYRHFPYERELAVREAAALFGSPVDVTEAGEVLATRADFDAARMLTYFSAARAGEQCARTLQAELERSAGSKGKRQSTRYSVHGLHEYRGKFNPQVCGALINILGVSGDQKLLDPFCGSGTTLVEAAHRGIESVGSDLNPLAVFIANAKLAALTAQAGEIEEALKAVLASVDDQELETLANARRAYLASWFEPEPLRQIEQLRLAISKQPVTLQSFFLVIASNLLRDFSLQDPADLRIRRRPTANATEPFSEAFARSAREGIRRLRAAQQVLSDHQVASIALHRDNRQLHESYAATFDAAITSPPYATALPYIDTQRLSLIWLDLLKPTEIAKVEADLIGSREMTTKEKRTTLAALEANAADLPETEATFCLTLQEALTANDGFRRQAVPMLLYRYFDLMGQTFKSVRKCFKSHGRFALIVGHNHTQLGGQRFDIDTPEHLASLAKHKGWEIEEVTPLQPYQRYGLHAANAVRAETLVVLNAGASPSG